MAVKADISTDWLTLDERPVLIAGPCSAETEEQVLETAQRLKHLNISYFRSGIWKPRTRPGAFEGIGEIGLSWLQKVQQETGLKTTVEAANAKHVELCLKYGVDMLWIGARSTVNPFTVQEIANALEGVDIPVMIKNPVNPDINLWIGAIERIQKAGINKIGAIHRGFTSYKKDKYRNEPMWEIPIELKHLMPELPLLCDPSHITGNRNWVLDISQKAIDLDFDGLMIETHPDPDKAWSDAAQQVTPETLSEILSKLIIRVQNIDDPYFNSTLEQLREIIDKQDIELIKVLKARMDIVEQVGNLKKEKNITIFQPERWHEIFESRPEWAEKDGLSKDLILRIFQLIHQESIRKQTEVMNRQEDEMDA